MFASLYGKKIAMGGNILGFPELDSFELIPIDDFAAKSPFAYLQSTEDQNVGFLVADPFSFHSDYQVELPDHEKGLLDVSDPQHVIVLVIVTMAEPFAKSTMNLLAPLVFNTNTLTGTQIVLPPETSYSTRTVLSIDLPLGEGEASC